MITEKKKSLIGKILLLSITLVWGSSFVILKDTLSEFSGGYFTFFILASRFLLASVCFALFSVKKLKTLNKEVVLNGCILGIFLFFAYGFQTVGLKYTSASKNAFLTASYCIIVPFLVWIFSGKRPSAKNCVAAVICLLGVAFIGLFGNSEKGENEFLGDALSLCCGLFYALQIYFNFKLLKGNDPILILAVECFTAGALFGVISAFYEFPSHVSSFSFSGEAIWKLAYLSLLATCFCQFGQLIGQKFVPPMVASLILSFESVFGMTFDILFGNANITVFIVLGFICIFTSVILNEVEFPQKIKKLD